MSDPKPAPPQQQADSAGESGVARIVTPAERQTAIERLSAAFARDVLPVDEFERRVGEAYRASTSDTLVELTRDLPDDPAAGKSPAPVASRATRPAPLRIRAVLSNVERGGRIAVPPHLEIRSLLGNVELDLRAAEFGPGVTEIHVRTLGGNVEVQLPDDLGVENHGGAFLGSFAVRAAGRAAGASGRTVRITGRAILGNVEFGRRR